MTSYSKYYPDREEVDAWIASIWKLVDATPYRAERLNDAAGGSIAIEHSRPCQYVKFEPSGMDTFYGYWQPAPSSPAPLLVHLPGYGATMSAHPSIVAAGFNILDVSPLGYGTPNGLDSSKQLDGGWPVLPDTIASGGERGYKQWLANCAMAVRWALAQPETLNDRVSFFGTSQGGGGSLLLGSLFRGRGVRCVAADVPFLTDFCTAAGRGAYGMADAGFQKAPNEASAWHAAGLIDTLSHAHRLDLPVLLTAGSVDECCPPETVANLFARLPKTRSFAYLDGVGHVHTVELAQLALAWFRLYA